MNKDLKEFSLEELKKEIIAREERSTQIELWKSTILKNYQLKNNPSASDISHILDYFNSSDSVTNLTRLAYPDAHRKSLKWTEELNRKNQHLKDSGLVHKLIDTDNGYKFVRLVDKTSRQWEGLKMGNCVADYKSSARLYSLRDKDEVPHVTIELNAYDRALLELKGKANEIPHNKYLPHILKFIKHFDITLDNDGYYSLGLIYLSPDDRKYLEDHFSGYNYSNYDNELYLRHDSPIKLEKQLIKSNQYLFDKFIECNICFEAQRQWISLDMKFPEEYLHNAIYAASLVDIKFALEENKFPNRSTKSLKNYLEMLKHSHGLDSDIKEIKSYFKDLIYKETFKGWQELVLKPYLENINYPVKERNKLANFIKNKKESLRSETFPRSEHNFKYFISQYELNNYFKHQSVFMHPDNGQAIVCQMEDQVQKKKELISWGVDSDRYEMHDCYLIYHPINRAKIGLFLIHENDKPLAKLDPTQIEFAEVFVLNILRLVEHFGRNGYEIISGVPIRPQSVGLINFKQSLGSRPMLNLCTYPPYCFQSGEDFFVFRDIPMKLSAETNGLLNLAEIKMMVVTNSTEAFLEMGIKPVVAYLALVEAVNNRNKVMVKFFLDQDTGYLKDYLSEIISSSHKRETEKTEALRIIIEYARNKYGLFPNEGDWFLDEDNSFGLKQRYEYLMLLQANGSQYLETDSLKHRIAFTFLNQ